MASRIVRSIRVDGNDAFIPLTQGMTAVIDAADINIIEQYNWKAVLLGRGKPYAMTWLPRVDGERKGILLHRLLLDAPADRQVDHVDGNGLNCRRANIRIATHAQNQWNVGITARNSSGFKGVKATRSGLRWRAQISFEGRQIHIGYFQSPEEAHAAYVREAARLHGEFARGA